MAVEVTMPQMGADMTEGTVVRWLKAVGEQVARGEVIAEIETDKATVELESFDAGVVLAHVVPEGETVPVGDVIAILGAAGEVAPELPGHGGDRSQPRRRSASVDGAAAVARAEQEAPRHSLPAPAAGRTAATPVAVARDAGASAGGAPSAGMRLRISPVAARIAVEAGVDVRGVTGSGPDGRILRRDVEAAIASGAARPAAAAGAVPAPARPIPPGATVVPLSRMRQTIARRMAQSKGSQPHYYLVLDVDMTDALEFRREFNELAGEGMRASINDLLVKACAIALARHPHFNAEFHEQGIVIHPAINIGIAIALDEGLIAPALRDCGKLSLGQIAAGARDLAERARAGRLHADEYGSATFTITNLGAFGVGALIGIINPPQAAILGAGSVAERPAVVDGAVVPRSLMTLALSADHRVTDGVEGARFLKEIQSLLENPAALAI